MKFLKILSELFKVKITIMVSLTTVLGYILQKTEVGAELFISTLGIFMLAGAASALNQYQERDIDAIMERTKNRPIPTGRIYANQALALSLFVAVLGSVVLYYGSGFEGMQLGILALLWYNIVYTNLKKKTAFAVVPGSLIGAIPPMVGWVAAGGQMFDTAIIITAFFMFIWQIPHFWLLAMKHGTEYEKAGLPSIATKYSSSQLRNITFVWTVATAISAMFIPFFMISKSITVSILLVLISIAMVADFSKIISKTKESLNSTAYFIKINVFLLLFIVLLITDRFITQV